jgi:hypothetical protein
MGSYITATKSTIQQIVRRITTNLCRVVARVAFVGYRDFCDGDRRLTVLDFTTDLNAFKAHVEAQPATGGGDEAEDVFGGLDAAIRLTWTSASKIIVHVADAPCHGLAFHDGCGDNYPGGHPNGLTAESLLEALMRAGVG